MNNVETNLLTSNTETKIRKVRRIYTFIFFHKKLRARTYRYKIFSPLKYYHSIIYHIICNFRIVIYDKKTILGTLLLETM